MEKESEILGLLARIKDDHPTSKLKPMDEIIMKDFSDDNISVTSSQHSRYIYKEWKKICCIHITNINTEICAGMNLME